MGAGSFSVSKPQPKQWKPDWLPCVALYGDAAKHNVWPVAVLASRCVGKPMQLGRDFVGRFLVIESNGGLGRQ